MSKTTVGSQELVRQYFRTKARQLAALSDNVLVEHSGLRGGHREEVCRIYLREILPKRFEVGRGMIYGIVHRSREVDIVLWDALNYPSLQFADHTSFFAESVRTVLEVKTRWSAEEFGDVRTKTRAVRDIITNYSVSLADEVRMLWVEIEALRTGREYDGMILARHHIGTSALFLRGGSSLATGVLTDADIATADDEWPDAMLLLEPGIVILKHYEAHGGISGTGHLEFYELGEDALLYYTHSLLYMLSDRVVHSEGRFYFDPYVFELLEQPYSARVQFPLTRPVPQSSPIWRR